MCSLVVFPARLYRRFFLGRRGCFDFMKCGVERLSKAFERTKSLFLEKIHHLLMRDPNAVDERTFLVFHGTEKAFEIIHDIQEPDRKSAAPLCRSGRAPDQCGGDSYRNRRGRADRGRVPFSGLFEGLNCFFRHVQPAFLKSASMTSSGPALLRFGLSGFRLLGFRRRSRQAI